MLVSRAADNSDGFGDRAYTQWDLCSLATTARAVPAEDRLCLAQIEINPPPYVEIVGARKVLRAMQEYLSIHGASMAPIMALVQMGAAASGAEPSRAGAQVSCGAKSTS